MQSWKTDVLFAVLLKTWVQDTASDSSEGWLERGKWQVRIYRSFLWGGQEKKERKKTPGIQHQTITANCIFKNRHLKLMNWSLFSMYEDARVQIYWIIPLICILAIYCQYSNFPFYSYPQGCTVSSGCSCCSWLDGGQPVYWNGRWHSLFIHCKMCGMYINHAYRDMYIVLYNCIRKEYLNRNLWKDSTWRNLKKKKSKWNPN